MTKNFKKIGSLLIGLSISASTAHAATTARAVGSGIAFPTLNFSTYQNPAGLAESPSASVQGLYDFDGSNIFGSGTIGQNGFGAGFTYTRLDASDSSQETFGVGAKLGSAMIGATLNSTEFGDFGLGAGLIFDLKGLRLATVVDGLTDGVSSVTVGVGADMGMWGVELDVTKSLADGAPSNQFFFNAGLYAMVQRLSLGLGYKFTLTGSDFSENNFWGGLSFAVTKGIFVEGFYNAGGTNIALGEWSAGARFQF